MLYLGALWLQVFQGIVVGLMKIHQHRTWPGIYEHFRCKIWKLEIRWDFIVSVQEVVRSLKTNKQENNTWITEIKACFFSDLKSLYRGLLRLL